MDPAVQQVFARWLADTAFEHASQECTKYRRKYEALRACWPSTKEDMWDRRRVAKCSQCRAETRYLIWCDYCDTLICSGCYADSQPVPPQPHQVRPDSLQHLCCRCGKTACFACSQRHFAKQLDPRNNWHALLCDVCLDAQGAN